MQRQVTLLGVLLFVVCGFVAGDAHAEEESFPRLHAGAQVGAGFANGGSTWVGGIALDGALGARFNEWLTLDATLMLENCLFCGRSDVGLLVSFEPGTVFTLGVGGGVGGLYFLRWGYGPNTASYGFGVMRTGFRFAGDEDGTLLVGAEGIAGATYAGTQVDEAGRETPRPPGTLVGGARLYFGFETN